MLLEHQPPRGIGKVAVVTRSPAFTRLLSSILESWKLRVVDDPSAAEMMLVEWGLATTAAAEYLIWLTPLPVEAPHLEIPLQLKRLYRELEKRFFTSARRFMRIPMDLPADLQVAGQRFTSRLISLSARGVRVSCPVELAKDQELTIEVVLGGRRLELPGEVLYALPAGEASRPGWPQLGIAFKRLDMRLCEALEHFVERICVEQCCVKLDLPLNSPCVSWLDVSRDPWAALSDSGSD